MRHLVVFFLLFERSEMDFHSLIKRRKCFLEYVKTGLSIEKLYSYKLQQFNLHRICLHMHF